MLRRTLFALLALLACLPTDALLAQRGHAWSRPLVTRAELEAAASQLRDQLPQDSLTRMRAGLVATRLEAGDFRSGDLILLDVPGELALTDTFTVGTDGTLLLPSPTVGALPLKGVLRIELEPTIRAFIGRFVAANAVRAWPLVRVAIEGEVTRAGYYAVPVDAPLADVLMAADGLTREADLRRVRIVRNGKRVMDHQEVRKALSEGWTASDVPLRPGDSIEIGQGRGTTEGRLRFTWMLVSLAGGLYGLTRAF